MIYKLFHVKVEKKGLPIGQSTKANAKAKGLNKLEKGIDFSSLGMKSSQGGRSSEHIGMTCDALKHFCLLAQTIEDIRLNKMIELEQLRIKNKELDHRW